MIFATIGTQMPFDRFIEIMDEIASSINEPVIAQTFKSKYQPKWIEAVPFLAPNDFNRLMMDARLIISHAGMGSVLSAIKYQKPIIIFPRLASLKEHRNDHQIQTAMKMNELGYAYVAYDKKQLRDLILQKDLKPLQKMEYTTSNNLIKSILGLINHSE